MTTDVLGVAERFIATESQPGAAVPHSGATTLPVALLTQRQAQALLGCCERTVKHLWARHADILVDGPANERGGGVGGRTRLLPITALPEWARAAFGKSGTPTVGGEPAEPGVPGFSLDSYLIWKATLPQKMQDVVERRRRMIVRWNALLAKKTGPDGKLTAKKSVLMAEFAKSHGTSAVSLWRLLERTDNLANFFSLAPDWGKRAGKGKLSDFDRAFLKELYANAERCGLRAAAIYDIYRNELARQGREPACENTVRAYLRSADCRMAKDFARLGRQKFIEQNGAYVSREQPHEPGFAYVSDHRQIDIPVVWHDLAQAMPWEPEDGRPRARWKDLRIQFPWVTAWMDEATFALVGEVVTDVPNSATVKRALARAVRDFGSPRHVLTDNGKDYLHLMLSPEGRTFERRCLWDDDQNRELLANIYNHLGIFGRHLSRPRNPRSKRIERFFAFLSLRLDVALVGWRGRGKGDRVAACDALIAETRKAIAEKRPLGLAHGTAMTRAEFEDLWRQFIAWDFHRERTAGRMKGRTPKEVWESCTTPIRRVGNDALWFLMLENRGRTVQKGGRVGWTFSGERIEWYSPVLLNLRGKKIDLRLDPDNMDVIHVCDPERGGALIAVAERVVKVPAYEDGEKALTKKAIEQVASANKRLIRATRDLGVAKQEALAAVANMGPTEFFGMPRGAVYTSVPDLSGRALTPVQTGFEAPAKAARAGVAAASQKRVERAARRTQERNDGPLTAVLMPVQREFAEPLVPLWKDIPLTIHHLEDPE